MGIQHTVYSSGGKDYELQLPDYIWGGTFLTWRWTPDNLFCMPNFCTTSFVWHCIPQKIKQCSISQCLIYWPLSVSFMSLVFFLARCGCCAGWGLCIKSAGAQINIPKVHHTSPSCLGPGPSSATALWHFPGVGTGTSQLHTIAGLRIIINDDIFLIFFPFLSCYTVFFQNCYQYMD